MWIIKEVQVKEGASVPFRYGFVQFNSRLNTTEYLPIPICWIKRLILWAQWKWIPGKYGKDFIRVYQDGIEKGKKEVARNILRMIEEERHPLINVDSSSITYTTAGANVEVYYHHFEDGTA